MSVCARALDAKQGAGVQAPVELHIPTSACLVSLWSCSSKYRRLGAFPTCKR